MTSDIEFILRHPSARPPCKAYYTDAGYDLSSVDSTVIKPGQRAMVSTGVEFSIPKGTYVKIEPRSGLALKNGIAILGGVIDSGYQGIVKVILLNTDTEKHFVVGVGDRIAQAVHVPLVLLPPPHVAAADRTPSRGGGGFGSTGTD